MASMNSKMVLYFRKSNFTHHFTSNCFGEFRRQGERIRLNGFEIDYDDVTNGMCKKCTSRFGEIYFWSRYLLRDELDEILIPMGRRSTSLIMHWSRRVEYCPCKIADRVV